MSSSNSRSIKHLTIANSFSKGVADRRREGLPPAPPIKAVVAVMKRYAKKGIGFDAAGRAVVPFRSMPNAKRNPAFHRP